MVFWLVKILNFLIWDAGKQDNSNELCANVDHQSDSNSEVSASESVANNRANLYNCGENEKGKFEKGNMAFIDFLGVGAT